MGYIIAAGLL
jgi:hypothetical protein